MPGPTPDRQVGTRQRQAAQPEPAPAVQQRSDVLQDSLQDDVVDPLAVQANGGMDAVQASGKIATIAPAKGASGHRAHPGAKGEKPFTAKEQAWIKQVLGDKFVKLLFSSYSDIPPAVLHRVQSIAGAKGQYSSKNDDVAVSDRVYSHKEKQKGRNGKTYTETNEESFKGTLIHELIHHAVATAQLRKAGLLLPKDLVTAMTHPTKAGFSAYAFGWFVHPKSSFILHFQLPDTKGFNPQSSLLGHPALRQVQKSGSWERSPMPKSGNSISVEEDLCESMSLALTSKRTLGTLASQYPNRYRLLNNYFKSLFRYAAKSKSP